MDERSTASTDRMKRFHLLDYYINTINKKTNPTDNDNDVIGTMRQFLLCIDLLIFGLIQYYNLVLQQTTLRLMLLARMWLPWRLKDAFLFA